jgi:tRNA/tmRNA/rRNA uracil-C5-methylase (TrmA/RlmC/RlmD family)
LDNEIFCPHFFTPLKDDRNSSKQIGCGGCKRQMISYDKQLKLKEEIVQDCFRKLEDKPIFLPII